MLGAFNTYLNKKTHHSCPVFPEQWWSINIIYGKNTFLYSQYRTVVEVSNFTPVNVYQGTHVSNGTRHTACIGKATRGPTTLGLTMNIPKTNQLHPRNEHGTQKENRFERKFHLPTANHQFQEHMFVFKGGNGTLVVWDSRGSGAPKIPFTIRDTLCIQTTEAPNHQFTTSWTKKCYHKNQIEVEYNEFWLYLNSSFCTAFPAVQTPTSTRDLFRKPCKMSSLEDLTLSMRFFCVELRFQPTHAMFFLTWNRHF